MALADAMNAALSIPEAELQQRSVLVRAHVQQHFDIEQSNEKILAICGLTRDQPVQEPIAKERTA
jgi:hypothetical protein